MMVMRVARWWVGQMTFGVVGGATDPLGGGWGN